MGARLYLQKDLIKGRALLLRASINTLATNLKWTEVVAEDYTIIEEGQNTYRLPKPGIAEDIPRFESKLNELSGFAQGRQGQLGSVNKILVSTRNTLDNTKATLATRERELSRARTEVADLESSIRSTEQELAQANSNIATLRGDIASQESRRDRLSNDLTARNNEIATLEIDLSTTIEERNIALDRYKRCRVGSENQLNTAGEWRGRSASILHVNDNWDYVVLDKGLVDELPADLVAYVHRGDEYVAKLQVYDVKDGVAIARIVSGSVAEGTQVQPGDTVFF